MLYRVVDNMAYGSQTIVNEFPAADGSRSPASTPGQRSFDGLRRPDPQRRPRRAPADRAAGLARPGAGRDRLGRGRVAAVRARPGGRPHDPPARGPHRRPGQDRRGPGPPRTTPTGRPATYREAAQAVASIPLDDPRAVLAGVLIDNLISVGRFEDAAATDRPLSRHRPADHRPGGDRRVAGPPRGGRLGPRLDRPRRPPRVSSQLYRRVNNGVLAAIEQNRSRDLSNRER